MCAPSRPVKQGIYSMSWVAFRYHVGTAAFGSLIIAIVQLIRAFVAYVQAKLTSMSASQHSSVAEAATLLTCCCACCLWVLEKVLKFVSNNAYTHTAIYGTGFGKSCVSAWTVVATNMTTITTLGLLNNVTMFITKLWIVGGTMLAAFYTLQYYYATQLWSIYGICVVTGFLAYGVAAAVCEVFECGTRTICYFVDEDASFCPRELKAFYEQDKDNATEVDNEDGVEVNRKG